MSTTTPTTNKNDEKERPSARFTGMVLKEYAVATGEQETTPDIRRRIQNFFVKIDMILQDNENKRMAKPESTRSAVAFDWKNVNLEKLASDVMILATLGLDPLMPNHVNPIPYLNGRTNLFDFGFIKGYKGIEIIARKYGLQVPEITIELVYSNDIFKAVKKDANNQKENYVFEIQNSFDRGELLGGFMYFSFKDNPELNRIEVMSKADIDKRKPKYASVEFWGGEKDIWKDGKKAGKESVEGWYEEMATKTLYRKAWGSITIDGSKVDELYTKMAVTELETETVDAEIIQEVKKEPIQLNPTAEVVTPIVGSATVSKNEPKAVPKEEKTKVVANASTMDFPESE